MKAIEEIKAVTRRALVAIATTIVVFISVGTVVAATSAYKDYNFAWKCHESYWDNFVDWLKTKKEDRAPIGRAR